MLTLQNQKNAKCKLNQTVMFNVKIMILIHFRHGVLTAEF